MHPVQIQNRDLHNAYEAVRILQHGVQRQTPDGPITEPALRLPGMTGLKLRRLARELKTTVEDLEAERIAILKRHADTDPETGELIEVETYGQKHLRYPNDDAKAAAKEEIDELLDRHTHISDSLALADLNRKERDASGKVYETDEIEGFIIDLLGPLLREEEPEAAKPGKPPRP